MTYTVIRTDLMSGTKQPADLVSVRFYDAEDKEASVENGVIVEMEGYLQGEREIIKAVAATASSALANCAVVASVEEMYDERKRNLSDFVNEAGTNARGYLLRSNNVFSITKEGFVGGTVPAKGAAVGIGAGGKLSTAATGFGTCIDVEVAGRYTYYVIRIGATEA